MPGVLGTTNDEERRVPLGLRIAIGGCDCVKPYRDAVQAKACEALDARLEGWLARLPADLSAIPVEAYEEELVDGHRITFGTHRRMLGTGDTIVVLQALVHTWARPTYLALGSIGRIYAEGLVVSSTGGVQRAPESLMWEFR